MKIAFEKATYNPLWPYGAVDRVIGWWTQSDYCHVELVLDQIMPELTFSATKEQGVRFGKIGDLHDPAHWDVVDVPCTLVEEQAAYAYARTQVGQKYNTVGLLRFAVGFVRDPKREEFCSQSVLDVVQHHPGLYRGVPPERVDPGFLYDLVICGQ